MPVHIAWTSARGRSRHDWLCATDGFRGEHPFASVIVVAEGTSGDRRSAEIAVSIIRDVFAEGVAYRVGEALVEAFHEAGERIRAEELRGCSATAAAVLGRDCWVVHAGGCRACVSGPAGARVITVEHTLAGEMGLKPSDPGYRQRVGDLTLQLGQKDLRPQVAHLALGDGESLVIMSSAVWRHVAPARTACVSSREGPAPGLEQLLRDSKARFRRNGGAAAAIGAGQVQGALSVRTRRRLRTAVRAALAVLVLAASALALSRAGCGHDDPGTDSSGTVVTADTTGLVLPLESLPDTGSTAASPGLELPVPCVSFGAAPPMGPDTLDAFVTPPPDSVYENLSSGVYYVSSDTLVRALAESLAARAGFEGATPLARIFVVRESDVPAVAALLPGLPPDDAAGTAVIVETRSSVAGGAAWIRSFALYANGNRARLDEPSLISGEPLEEFTTGPDSSGYRLLFVP
jgi:hypothetical protein